MSAVVIVFLAGPAWADANRPPRAPSDLGLVPDATCNATPLDTRAGNYPTLVSTPVDPDGDLMTLYYEVYSDGGRLVQELARSHQFSGVPVRAGVEGPLAEGRYAWRVRADDGTAGSAWSASCRFAVDLTDPVLPPLVFSPGYPEGQRSGRVALPGTFVFDAQGDRDVVTFRYGLNASTPTTTVPAQRRGGRAQVEIAPNLAGLNRLEVESLDASGNPGPRTVYEFEVPPSFPISHWTFNEGSGQVAGDLTGRRGLVLRGPTWTSGVRAEFGPDQALHFSGADAAWGGNAVPTAGNFSVAVWLRADDLRGSPTILEQRGDEVAAFRLGYSAAADRFVVDVAARDDADDPGGQRVVVGRQGLSLDDWTLLVLTYDRYTGTLRTYLDGDVAAVASGIGAPFRATGPFVLGSGGGLGRPAGWVGDLDAVQVFDAVLSDAEASGVRSTPTGAGIG